MYEFGSTLYALQYALQSLAIPIACGIIIAITFSGFLRLISKDQKFLPILIYYGLFSIPVGLVAFTAGLLTGLSRAPAVGTVLPAVLALIGGLNVYIFGTENKFKLVVGYCVSVFVFMLLLGMQTGALQREHRREARLIDQSEQEVRIRDIRRRLDLPSDMPAWIT
jgi:hypothetical protein